MLEKEKEEQDKTTEETEEESDNGVGGNHPFLYMLGNLMKKMDTKHIDKDTTKTALDYGKRREEIQERGNPRYGKRNSDSISENQITNFKSKPEVMKNYPQSIETGYEEPIEEDNLNLREKTGMNLNQNPNNKVSERKLQTIVEH